MQSTGSVAEEEILGLLPSSSEYLSHYNNVIAHNGTALTAVFSRAFLLNPYRLGQKLNFLDGRGISLL